MLEAALLVLEFVVHVRYQFQLLEQDTIENVSKPIKNQKNVFLISFYATFLCGCYNVFEKTAPENMKKHLKSCS